MGRGGSWRATGTPKRDLAQTVVEQVVLGEWTLATNQATSVAPVGKQPSLRRAGASACGTGRPLLGAPVPGMAVMPGSTSTANGIAEPSMGSYCRCVSDVAASAWPSDAALSLHPLRRREPLRADGRGRAFVLLMHAGGERTMALPCTSTHAGGHSPRPVCMHSNL